MFEFGHRGVGFDQVSIGLGLERERFIFLSLFRKHASPEFAQKAWRPISKRYEAGSSLPTADALKTGYRAAHDIGLFAI